MSGLPTPRLYAGVHRVDAVCVACDRWVTLDLDDLIRRGMGDVPLIRLPLRRRVEARADGGRYSFPQSTFPRCDPLLCPIRRRGPSNRSCRTSRSHALHRRRVPAAAAVGAGNAVSG